MSNICGIPEVKLLKLLPLNNTEGVTAHVNQHKVEKERTKNLDGVNLDGTKLSSEQKD